MMPQFRDNPAKYPFSNYMERLGSIVELIHLEPMVGPIFYHEVCPAVNGEYIWLRVNLPPQADLIRENIDRSLTGILAQVVNCLFEEHFNIDPNDNGA